MTKAELLRSLSKLPDNSEVVIWIPTQVSGSDCHTDYDAFRITDVVAWHEEGMYGAVIADSEMIDDDSRSGVHFNGFENECGALGGTDEGAE